MKINNKILLLCCLININLQTANSQQFTSTNKELLSHLEVLTSDSCAGRYAGDIGQKVAAKYIAERFKEYGLKSFDTLNPFNYYQKFQLQANTWKTVQFEFNSKRFELGKDLYLFGNIDGNFSDDNDFVFVSYGIESENYSNYKNIDVNNKWVLMQYGEPKDSNGNYKITQSDKPSKWSNDWRLKIKTAQNKGAKGVLFLATPSSVEFKKRAESFMHHIDRPRMVLPNQNKKTEISVMISPEMYVQILKIDTNQIKFFLNRTDSISNLSGNLKVNIECQSKLYDSENVIGYIKGTEKPDEYIFLSAHYDHLGKIDSVIYRGADDDATGVSAILEIAHSLSTSKKKSKRSIAFIAFSGEEHGLLGSYYYSENPIVPFSKTVCNLNIDMIGRLDDSHLKDTNFVYIIGDDKLSNDLRPISEKANSKFTKLNLDYKFNSEDDPNRFYYRSDHYNFAKNNIPIIFYFNGVHPDYHKPTDTLDKIIVPKVHKITKLVFYTMLDVANRKRRIKPDKKLVK